MTENQRPMHIWVLSYGFITSYREDDELDEEYDVAGYESYEKALAGAIKLQHEQATSQWSEYKWYKDKPKHVKRLCWKQNSMTSVITVRRHLAEYQDVVVLRDGGKNKDYVWMVAQGTMPIPRIPSDAIRDMEIYQIAESPRLAFNVANDMMDNDPNESGGRWCPYDWIFSDGPLRRSNKIQEIGRWIRRMDYGHQAEDRVISVQRLKIEQEGRRRF